MTMTATAPPQVEAPTTAELFRRQLERAGFNTGDASNEALTTVYRSVLWHMAFSGSYSFQEAFRTMLEYGGDVA